MSAATSSEPDKLLNVLTSDYKEEVLKELLDNPGYTYTVNEIAEEVSGSYNSVKNFLRELERFDIVSFQKKGGTYLIQYNQNSRYHEVLKELLRADNKPLREAAENYASKIVKDIDIKNQIKSVILFGSVARGTAGPDSDIDILVLTEDHADIDRIKTSVRNYAEKQVDIENDVVPVLESSKEFRNNFSHGKRFETNVSKDGIVLEGEELDFKN